MPNEAKVSVESGDPLDVRWFRITQAMSRLFQVELRVVSRRLDVDFDEVIGKEAVFSLGTVTAGYSWRGICSEMDQVRVDRDGLATYTLIIAPRAYLMTQRKNYRTFQYLSELAIVQQLLDEWRVPHRVRVDAQAHQPRKFRVQYGETDFAFACRMLEDAGISFRFEDSGEATTMVLDDAPERAEVSHAGLLFHDSPNAATRDFVTNVAVGFRTRPGKTTLSDVDYRRASGHQPRLSATMGLPQEALLEQFDHEPGAFLYQRIGAAKGHTLVADDRGVTRTDEAAGDRKTKNRLCGLRQDAGTVRLESSVLGLSPGIIFSVAGHQHVALDSGAGLLTTRTIIEGNHDEVWRAQVEAAFVDVPFRPRPHTTPKPRAGGLESATVVGPADDEIHTDEYGRVRVHFHWDRESSRDENSSCWLPVSQAWAGAGFGGVTVPRIGQEVLVAFLDGDPDRPVVVGRVFTEQQPPPYPMPAGMRLTGLVGKSSPELVMGAEDEGLPHYRMRDQLGTYGNVGSNGVFYAVPPPPLSYIDQQNAFVVGDAQGSDITFLRSRRDMNVLVKNKWTSVVGNYRAIRVGGGDTLHIKNKQKIEVKNEQALRVRGTQTVEVGGRREETVKGDLVLKALMDLIINSEGTIVYKAKQALVLQSFETIRFEVGESSISLNQTTIIVDSPSLHINPRS